MKEFEQSLRLLPWAEIERRVPYTRQWVGRLEKVGRFPRRVQIGPNRVGWVESEIDAHIAELVAARDQASEP